MRLAPWEDRWVPEELAIGPLPEAGRRAGRRRASAGSPTSRSAARRASVVLSWPEEADRETAEPGAVLRDRSRRARTPPRRSRTEEVFGPAEGLHSTYRMIRDEVLESSWRAGSALSEMRLDTAEDVNARRRPLPRADQARGAPPAARAGGDARGAGRDQRAARPRRLARAARRARDLGARRLRPGRGARARGARGADRRPGASRRWSSSSRAAATASPSRRRTSTSTGPARSSTSSRASSRSRRSRRSTSGSGS